ncbi:MAG: Na+/H+ antiporter NhaC [Proteocatella sp.]
MSKEPKVKQKRQPKLWEAFTPIIALIILLYVGLVIYGADAHVPLVIASAIAVGVAIFRLGYTWGEIENGILKTINMGMQAIIILMIVGMLVGTWIQGGVVPTMIFYGLQILSPSIFLVATVLICSVVALATGSSWTTAGTVGIALVGIGQGIGIPAPVAAGAIISGAYFGDKMSPLSDTTNLAPAMAGATLFDHVKHMIFTTGPSYIIALIAFGIMGTKYAGQQLDLEGINELLMILTGNFNISLLMLIPPVVVILMVVFKVPAIPGLIGGVVLGAFFGMAFQGVNFGDILGAANGGYSFPLSDGAGAAEIMIADLLSRGGMQSMMWTVSLIICALTFGGVLEATGMLGIVATTLLKFANGTGSLVLITIFTSIFINVVAADQYLSIVIPGRMYKEAYSERGLSPRNLSRTLEDGGTITSALIPWNTCGAFMSGALGVETVAYLPYCIFNLVNPIVSVTFAFLGLFQMKMTDEEKATYEASKLEHA